jgi:hypothetical protein
MPGVELAFECEYGSLLGVGKTMDRETLVLLPSLNRGDTAAKIRGDLFPRIQTVVSRIQRNAGVRWRLVHGTEALPKRDMKSSAFQGYTV